MLRKWHGNPWAILAVLCLGFFMTLLDLTIVNVAIPDLTDDLDASLDDVLWVVNAYSLALATLIITAGRLGDLRGKRNIFLAGVAVFTIASLACGLAQDPTQLIAFRAVQGVGAAMLMPQTLSIVADVFPPEKRGAALGIWGATGGVAGVVGPTLGGVLTTHLDWRWIFYINIPLGLLVLFMGLRVMPVTGRMVKHRFDIPGVALASAALFCLAFGLTEGEKYDWNGGIWALIGASGVLFLVFLAYERTQQDNEPLVPFSLFKDRNFSIVNFMGIAVSFGVIGFFLPTTIYMQSVLGFSAQKTGLVLLPLALATMMVAGPAGVLSEKFGGKYVLTVGLGGFAAGLTWLVASAETDSEWTTFIGPLLVIGVGVGCTFAPMASEVMRNVPPHLTGAASGVNNALRQVGSVLAGAVIGAVLQAQLASSLVEEAEKGAEALPPEFRDGFVGGFEEAGDEGLDVGTEQGTELPDGIPADIAQTIQELSGQVFGNGFVDAFGPTVMVSAGILLAGALATFVLKGGATPSGHGHGMPAAQPQPESGESAAVPG
ncbi:DHA2 family efflux MFS transporter permease subunit [Streptomyces sp. URMC 129]|uniref:DHA2 family efflux MFS transporter permease subunit n=1 Tax=Streptomyces sp. URMC 129 TaxID=3423407 RepID=UPI003F1DB6CD